ncbi:hypothetical protein ACIOD2_32510 [Amycolatopsis sp. NPDC088138]|uniref:hypothetical protein n=1 Tax=Amycolatopsis sp. NPDC088138 TaxID=3363938 RepID=UPI00381360A6
MDDLSGLMPEMPADCVKCGGWFELNDMDSCMACSPRVMCRDCYRAHIREHEDDAAAEEQLAWQEAQLEVPRG